MRFRNQLALTIAVQGSGAIATLATIFVLGVSLGPQQQGIFSRLKTETEFIGALATLGLPQALFYFSGTRRLSRVRSLAIASAGACLAALCGVTYRAVSGSTDLLTIISFGCATAFFVLHGNLRTLLLADRTSVSFNVVTALPQLMLFALAGAAIATGTSMESAAVFLLVAYLVGSVLAIRLLGCRNGDAHEVRLRQQVGIVSILRYGLLSWVAAVGSSGSTVMAMRHAEVRAGPAALGVFSAALALVQIAITPINYVAPLILKRWLGSERRESVWKTAIYAAAAPTATFAAVLGLISSLPTVRPMLGAYGALLTLSWWLVLTIAAEAAARVMATSENADGRPWSVAGSELVRAGIIACGLFGLKVSTLTGTTALWAIAAIASACTLAGQVARHHAFGTSRRLPEQ